MKKMVSFLFVACFVVFSACSGSGSKSAPDNSPQTGSISVKLVNADTPLKNIDGPLKSINVASIAYYNVSITGKGITPVTESNVPSTALGSRLYQVQVVKNAIIRLEPLDAAKNPIAGNSTKLAGYCDVVKDTTSTVTIDWNTTVVADVLDALLALSYDITTYAPAALQTAVNTAITGGTKPLSIDTASIAANIKTAPSYTTITSKNLASITGKVVHGSGNVANIGVIINVPCIADVLTDANGNFTLGEIPPGVWNITLSESGSASVTVAANGTYTPNPLVITKGNNTPIIYSFGFNTLTENGVSKTVARAAVGDLDGVSDLASVTITSPASVVYTLTDNGTGLLYDTVANDGIYEALIPSALADGNYIVAVTDKTAATSSSADAFTFTYIPSTSITNPTDAQVITTKSPLVQWSAAAGASFYKYQLIKNSDSSIVQTDAGITSPLEFQVAGILADGVYTVKIFAYVSTAASSPYSLTTSAFTLSTAGSPDVGGASITVNPGTEKFLYYKKYSSSDCKYTINNYNLSTNVNSVIESDASSDNIVEVAPNGQNILYSKSDGLYRANSNGTIKFKLTADTVYSPKWSPDGTKIFYYKKKSSILSYDIYCMNADGSNVKVIVFVSSNSSLNFLLSSDRVFYSTSSSTSSILYSVNYNGLDSKSVTLSSSSYVLADISESFGKILLYYSGSSSKIATVNLDVTGLNEVTPSVSYLSNPRFMMDGKLLFSVYSSSAPYYSIYTMKSNGTALTKITVTGYEGSAFSKAIPSFDGKRLLVYHADYMRFCYINMDGSGYAVLSGITTIYTLNNFMFSSQVW
jgi:hypothetical protein